MAAGHTDRQRDRSPGGGGSAPSKAASCSRLAVRIEITDARGTQLVVTPAFWESQQKWYLNVNVYQTSATEGIWGRLADDSWLPALPDGTSLGTEARGAGSALSGSVREVRRCVARDRCDEPVRLRAGHEHATFTLTSGRGSIQNRAPSRGRRPASRPPRRSPRRPATAITDADQKADCIFDVTVTVNRLRAELRDDAAIPAARNRLAAGAREASTCRRPGVRGGGF